MDRAILREELGDVLWYFVTLCRRLGVSLTDVVVSTYSKPDVKPIQENMMGIDQLRPLSRTVERLGVRAAMLLSVTNSDASVAEGLRGFWQDFWQCLAAARVDIGIVIAENIAKIRGRFTIPTSTELPTFDDTYPEGEKLPMSFRIEFIETHEGAITLRWNGNILGDELDDSIMRSDDYRFHDVFHLANAAVLHWSPTFRKLTGRKRRSNPSVDRGQDGGRAIAIEEGLTAWMFAYAKERAFLEGSRRLPFDLLKGVSRFVTGYEVHACPLGLWEQGILEGFKAFRALANNRGGVVVGERADRMIGYECRS